MRLLRRVLRHLTPTTQAGIALLGVSQVFYVANWISISAGKGWQPTCTIIGCMLAGGGIALIIAGGKERR